MPDHLRILTKLLSLSHCEIGIAKVEFVGVSHLVVLDVKIVHEILLAFELLNLGKLLRCGHLVGDESVLLAIQLLLQLLELHFHFVFG